MRQELMQLFNSNSKALLGVVNQLLLKFKLDPEEEKLGRNLMPDSVSEHHPASTEIPYSRWRIFMWMDTHWIGIGYTLMKPGIRYPYQYILLTGNVIGLKVPHPH